MEPIARSAQGFGKPIWVDIQDAYRSQLEVAINQLLDFGVSGVNLEDCDRSGKLYDVDTATRRVQRVLGVARKRGVPDPTWSSMPDAMF